jgi:hypothetical protein
MIKNDYGIKEKPITVRNPQANAIVERVHQVIWNIIQTFELESNYLDEDDPWKGILSATAFVVLVKVVTTDVLNITCEFSKHFMEAICYML